MIKKHGGNVHKFAIEHNISVNDILDYSANINPLGLSSKVIESLNQLDSILNYPDPNYTSLIDSIATYEKVKSDCIIVGNGGIECLFLTAEQLKLKDILIPVPTFVEYERAFSKYGDISYYYNKKPFGVDVDDLIKQLDGHDGLILCNPNNPTGYLIDRDNVVKIVKYAQSKNITVILDEAFIDFTDDENANTMVSMINEFENLIILKSLTKFFAMPGLRLGYLMSGSSEFLNGVRSTRMPWSINSMAAHAGQAALTDETYIKKTKTWIKEERLWFTDALKALNITVYPTQGNYIFFEADNGLDKKLEKFGVMIRNCSNYEGLTEGYYRVAIKDRTDNLKLLGYLKEILWKL